MKICIVGSSPSSEMQAPFEDENYEIWVLAQRMHLYPRYNKVFQIHEELRNVPKDHIETLNNCNVEVVVSGNGKIEGTVFPYDEATKLLEGMNGEIYLTSTIAYMMALAILEGATEILIYGVDMAVAENEYFHQRPCLEAWIGFARGRGIEVKTPPVCPLFKAERLYGVDEYINDIAKSKAPFNKEGFEGLAKMHREKHSQIETQIRILENQLQANGGALQAYEAMIKVARAIEDGQSIESLTHTVRSAV